MNIVEVNVANFDELVLNSEIPVLVDFWAPWCGPCRMVAPILESLAGETDSVLIAKINVDENGALASQYQVRGIPTLALFKNGDIDKRISGVKPLDYLREFIQ